MSTYSDYESQGALNALSASYIVDAATQSKAPACCVYCKWEDLLYAA